MKDPETAARPVGRREAQRIATRTVILDAAEGLFAELGYDGASMRSVARDAHTSQALLHHHFGTKEGLHAEVTARIKVRASAFAEQWVGSLRDASGEEEVVAAVDAYVSFMSEDANLWRLRARALFAGQVPAAPFL